MKWTAPDIVIRRCPWILALAVVLAAAGPAIVAADEPEPTPTPAPTPAPSEGESLSDVAKDIHLDVGEAEAPEEGIVITDENISEYAEKSLLTERKSPLPGDEGGPASAQSGRPGGPPEKLSPEETKKQYWRNKYLDQKKLIESIEAEIESLDAEIPALWSKFYSWDDPAYRDGVIKPSLDRALARREELGTRLEKEREALPSILEQARKDGAKPGWFRGLT
jgi:hypothetical protein